MTLDRIVTRLRLGNAPTFGYPAFTIIWERDEASSMSYLGHGTLWNSGTERCYRYPPNHERSQADHDWTASLGLTIPAYHMALIIEPISHGSWRIFGDLPADLSLATFWWASTLFLESLRDHPHWPKPKASG